MRSNIDIVLFGILVGIEDVKLSCVGIGKLYSSAARMVVAVAREVYDEIGHGSWLLWDSVESVNKYLVAVAGRGSRSNRLLHRHT
jgi:hypothetical protein